MTTDCIKQNPANYTVWEYRRQIIKALNIELDSEFAWTSSIIARNIKNFQVWHHRQVSTTFIHHIKATNQRARLYHQFENVPIIKVFLDDLQNGK